MKRQTQNGGSDINKQNICGGKNSFLNRELSESEATLPLQGTGSSQQVPPLPAQGLCTVAAWSLESAQEMLSVCFSCF